MPWQNSYVPFFKKAFLFKISIAYKHKWTQHKTQYICCYICHIVPSHLCVFKNVLFFNHTIISLCRFQANLLSLAVNQVYKGCKVPILLSLKEALATFPKALLEGSSLQLTYIRYRQTSGLWDIAFLLEPQDP